MANFGPAWSCLTCKIREQESALSRDCSLRELQRSAECGCSVCASIFRGLQLWGITKQPNSDVCKVSWLSDSSLSKPLRLRIKNPGGIYVSLIMYTSQEEVDERSPFGFARQVPASSSSASTFQLAISWLKECLHSHLSCKSDRDFARPARLVDVGSSDSDIRLIDVPTSIIQYIALSYCWGPYVPLKTEKDSLGQRKAGIGWASLPQTFKDAISITRRLGYQYIWIDALCIVQDDDLDWQLESSKMADIYENAIVTVSVAWAPDCVSGCFHRRYYWNYDGNPSEVCWNVNQPIGEDKIQFQHQIPGGPRQTVHVCTAFDHEMVKHQRAQGSPLYSRAWAYQERILSPRVLQYTRSELCWECRTHIQCECGDITNIPSWRADSNVSILDRLRSIRSPVYTNVSKLPESPGCACFVPFGLVKPHRFDALAEWRRLLGAYSGRKLSWGTDKLPAFSGIAKRVQKQELGSYCAGLWEAELPTGLLWKQATRAAFPNASAALRTKTSFRAPTWSWACVDGEIVPARFEHSYQCFVEAKLKDVYCLPVSVNPYGQVSKADIILEVPIIQVRWEAVSEVVDRVSCRVTLEIDGPTGSVGIFRLGYVEEKSVALKSSYKDIDIVMHVSGDEAKDLEQIGFPKVCYFIPIVSMHREGAAVPQDFTARLDAATEVQGLVLVESKDVPKAFERAGPASCFSWGPIGFGGFAKMTTIKIV